MTTRKRPASKKAAAKKKAPAKKAAAKKSAAKKAAAKKVAAKKATAKKSAARKAPAQKAPAKKVAAKKAPAKKRATTSSSSSSATTTGKAPRTTATTPPVWKPAPDRDRSFSRQQPEPRRAANGKMWHLLDVPYQLRDTAKYAGARWDAEMRRWAWYGAELPRGLQPFAAQPYSWEAWLQDDANGGWLYTPLPSAPITLREHQRDAADAIQKAAACGRPGFLLADDVGLGKTYSTIAGVDALGENLRVLVLSPLSVIAHWRRSIQAMDTGRNRWCVLNYDRVKNLLEAPTAPAGRNQRKRTKNRDHAQKGTSIVEWDVIILDEAHKLRNPLSQRSAATRRVIAGGQDTFCVYLSATAGQNPLELSYLSPMLAHATGSKVRDLTDFESWCLEQGFSVKKGSFGQWSWTRSEEELERMNKLLFSRTPPYGIRRRPQDLAGWPELQRIAFPQDLNATERSLYEEAWEEFCRAMELETKGKHSKNALTAALRLRQKASLLRCEQTANLAADLVDDGHQVAISVQFLDTANRIQEALRAKKIPTARVTGELSAQEREVERVRFQQGEASVVLFTVTEGISLHANEKAVSATGATRSLLLHDMRWSALDVAQIEGRCHRDGENAAVWYLFAPDSVEEKVARAVLQRLEDMGDMLGDDTTGLDALWDAVGTAE
jgi:superfamily II DNA or RNA helicase